VKCFDEWHTLQGGFCVSQNCGSTCARLYLIVLRITFSSASDICLMLVFGMRGSTFCKCLQMCVKKTMYSSLFSTMASRFSLCTLTYCLLVFCCMSLDKIVKVILLACKTYEAQLTVKCVRVSVAVRIKSLKN
jgi:hypothetical protein